MKAPTLSLAAGVLPDFSPQETARAAVDSGFDATGVWVDLSTWTAQTTTELKSILGGSGMSALDVEVVWLQPGPADSAHLKVVDIGLELGAANVLVVSSDPDDASTAAKLAALCEHGGNAIRIALEFAMFTEVRSLAQASAIVSAVDHPAASLLIDPLHLSRCGDTPAGVSQIPRQWLAYAQFCDVGPLTFDPANRDAIIVEAIDERLMPGDGTLPLKELLDAFPAGLPLSLELRSKWLRETYPAANDRAAALLAATRSYFDAL
ncbi:sugar phosphate isomerase/epimerase family protein [Novosphingobium tardum]|uniref:Sugar phosphate isomerase/epimerase family protein n=1 Tax=Novosphingobium tardum TaxID=1538021 RepID=A0ABV8RSN4_9SPHN